MGDGGNNEAPRERKRKSRWDVADEPSAGNQSLVPDAASLALEAIRLQAQARLEALVASTQTASPSSTLIQAPGVKPGVSSTQVGGALVTSHSGARVFYPPALPAAPPEGGMVPAPGGIGRVFIPPVDQYRRRSPSPPSPSEQPAPAPRKRRGFRETVEPPTAESMPPPALPRSRDRFREADDDPSSRSTQDSLMPPPPPRFEKAAADGVTP